MQREIKEEMRNESRFFDPFVGFLAFVFLFHTPGKIQVESFIGPIV